MAIEGGREWKEGKGVRLEKGHGDRGDGVRVAWVGLRSVLALLWWAAPPPVSPGPEREGGGTWIRSWC